MIDPSRGGGGILKELPTDQYFLNLRGIRQGWCGVDGGGGNPESATGYFSSRFHKL